MEFRVTSVDDVTVVAISGRFDAPAAPEAERAFADLAATAASRYVVDFSGVEYISSGGLRVVLMLSRTLAKTSAKLKLCGLNPFVAEVFEISRFSELFDIYPDQETALTAYRVDTPED